MRTALGATPGSVFVAIARRAFFQLVMGTACLGPTLRGLRIRPVEALREA